MRPLFFVLRPYAAIAVAAVLVCTSGSAAFAGPAGGLTGQKHVQVIDRLRMVCKDNPAILCPNTPRIRVISSRAVKAARSSIRTAQMSACPMWRERFLAARLARRPIAAD